LKSNPANKIFFINIFVDAARVRLFATAYHQPGCWQIMVIIAAGRY
jgi:hypothetical protein